MQAVSCNPINLPPEIRMYTPASFVETDLAKLHDAIERYSFATLISSTATEIEVSHLPLLLDRQGEGFGTLIGHMARANPQWRDAAGQQVLAVFSGPHAYISPTWYTAPSTVPTWNYVAVHATGRLQLVEDQGELLQIVRDFVTHYERDMPQPWSIDAPADFLDSLVRQIVGFRIEITRLEGKWKLNQNHPADRRQRVIAALEAQGDDNSLAIAALMATTFQPRT